MLASMSDAHREWHWNTGVPMGTPGCPQDACHPVDDWMEEEADSVAILCGHCRQKHYGARDSVLAEIRACATTRKAAR